MQRIFSLVPIFLVLQSYSYKADMDTKALSSVVAQFSAKFVNELDKRQSSVSSPLSAEFVLALLTLGTSGEAHDELLTTLGVPDDDSIRSSFSEVSSKLRSIKGVTLNVANKVYVMEGDYDLQPQVKEDAIKVFDAAFEKVNFSQSEDAAKIINSWVEEKTNKRITKIISPDNLGALCRLVLVNAIYFKGTWKIQFNPQLTSEKPFYVTPSTIVNVPMMYKADNYIFGTSSELKSQLLQMPYVGNEASMLIVLPDEIDGLDSVLKKLAAGYDLLADVDKMYNTRVQVTIPKFKIETSIDLRELLPKIGIQKIFCKENSGITRLLNSGEYLYVSKAIQKAFIEVNEEGAEAAAVTAGIVRMRRSLQQEHMFVVNRPALWCITVAGQIMITAIYKPTSTVRDEL